MAPDILGKINPSFHLYVGFRQFVEKVTYLGYKETQKENKQHRNMKNVRWKSYKQITRYVKLIFKR